MDPTKLAWRICLLALIVLVGMIIQPSAVAAVDTAVVGADSAAETARPMPTGALVVIGVYCVMIVLASLTGGWLPTMMELTHTRMQLIVSFVGGVMLGVGVFHMLPHSFDETGSSRLTAWWVMVGLVAMFFMLRMFHFHHHGIAETDDGTCDLEHDPDHHHHAHHHAGPHKLSWAGVAFGLAVHTLIDGMALAASVQADARYGMTTWAVGVGTFAAILLHKPLDAVSITSLMTASGWSSGWRNTVNAGFALMCPVGAIIFWLGIERFGTAQHTIIGCALAFSAGVFLCISLSDLLPEIEFHSHDRFKLTVALLAGITLAYAIGFLEPDHLHLHPVVPNASPL